MTFVELLLVALALAADAFTVGLAVGLSHRRPRQLFRLSFHFGLFQALLPLFGAFLGSVLERWFAPWSHWFAFGLLVIIGVRMVFGALGKEGASKNIDLTRGFRLVGLSLSVSIDALAVGFTLGLRQVSILLAVTTIGVVAAVLTLVGMLLAGRIPAASGKRAEIVAGLVLVGLGIKTVVEHYFF